MLSHKLQIPGKPCCAVLSWAAVPRWCLLPPGSLALRVLPSLISKTPKSTKYLQALPFPHRKKKKSYSSKFLSKPQNKYFLVPITACLQVGHSKGTRVSLGRSGQGWHCSCALAIPDGPVHGQHCLHRLAPDWAARKIQHCFTFWGCVRKHKKDHFSLK